MCSGGDICVYERERERDITMYAENEKIVLTRSKNEPTITKRRRRYLCSHLLSKFSY